MNGFAGDLGENGSVGARGEKGSVGARGATGSAAMVGSVYTRWGYKSCGSNSLRLYEGLIFEHSCIRPRHAYHFI